MVGSRLLARGRGPAIPLATTADLAAPVRRTLALRIGIAVALVVLALAASETGRSNAAAARGLLPGGGSGVLVLDVSRSIKPSANRTIVNVLQQLINSQSRVGLVAFSDIAYELFPPGTPSRELRPLLRFFAPLPAPQAGADSGPPNPWTSSFSGGTQISRGLILAHDALARAGNPHGSILLVSDLDTAPDDVPRVAQTFNTFRAEGVKFRIVPLTPRPDNLSLFQNLAGKGAFVPHVASIRSGVGDTEGALRGKVPWSLIVVAALVLLALAANEHWNGRLPVPRTQP
jgi:von Willebrand factor type A domain